MTTSQFKPFAVGDGNEVTTQTEWQTSTDLQKGFTSGILTHPRLNKALRQATFPVAALMQAVADLNGIPVKDDGDMNALTSLIKVAFSAARAWDPAGSYPSGSMGEFMQQLNQGNAQWANGNFIKNLVAGLLTEAELSSLLLARINLIDMPEVGLVTKVADLVTTYGSTANAATSAAAALQSQLDALDAKNKAIIAKGEAYVSETNATAAKVAAVTAKGSAESEASSSATSASSAAGSASNAATSASTSATSAATAATYATAASTSATNAATSSTNAQSYATASNTSANTATTKAAEAKTYSENAATSASNANSSAAVATTKAGVATNAATDAGTYATAASTSAGNASSSATLASQKATASDTSATNASTYASNANTYASQASSSASTATTRASEAANSALAAATSATNAGNSASSAAGSANTASTKASDAGTYATSASNSATAAATSAGGASTYASQASTSASNAAGSASSASTSSSAAATSATNAGNSASASSTSASNASTYASNASDSATAAAGWYNATVSATGSLKTAVELEATTRATETGVLNAQYVMKTTAVRPDGKVVLGAIGIASQSTSTSSQSEILLQADRLTFVSSANPNGPPKALLTTGLVGGVDSVIISSAIIGDLSVQTLNIAGNAVTQPIAAGLGGDTGVGDWTLVLGASAYVAQTATYYVTLTANTVQAYDLGGSESPSLSEGQATEYAANRVYLYINSVQQGWSQTQANGRGTVSISAVVTLGPGTHTFQMYASTNSYGNGYFTIRGGSSAIIALGAKK